MQVAGIVNVSPSSVHALRAGDLLAAKLGSTGSIRTSPSSQLRSVKADPIVRESSPPR